MRKYDIILTINKGNFENMNLSKFILFLTNLDGVGDSTIRKLIISNCFRSVDFKSAADVLNWIKSHRVYFSSKFDINKLTIDTINDAKKNRVAYEEMLASNDVKYVTYFDTEYPDCLKQINDFPIILYYKGDINLLSKKKKCAIIGTRKITNKGIEKCKLLSSTLTKKNYVIISGLAEGCDTLAHKICLDERGKTIAILGGGLDSIYPKINKELAEEIVRKRGLLISEYPLGFKVRSFSLVQRDRLQAACSNFVIAIQTDINGGTMHACKAALNKYGKRVYVVSPKELEIDSARGNSELINKYFAQEIIDGFIDEKNL